MLSWYYKSRPFSLEDCGILIILSATAGILYRWVRVSDERIWEVVLRILFWGGRAQRK